MRPSSLPDGVYELFIAPFTLSLPSRCDCYHYWCRTMQGLVPPKVRPSTEEGVLLLYLYIIIIRRREKLRWSNYYYAALFASTAIFNILCTNGKQLFSGKLLTFLEVNYFYSLLALIETLHKFKTNIIDISASRLFRSLLGRDIKN